MRFSDSHHFRKMVAGCCMVAGSLLVLVAFVVSPAIHTDAGEQLAAFAAEPDRTVISALVSMAAVALMVGAVLGLMHMMRERMPAYGHIGGAMALIGLVAYAAQFGALMLAWQMASDGVQPADVAAWDGLIGSTAGVVALSVVAWIGTAGFVVLAAGLYRAHAVDWWMAAMVAIGAVGIALAGPLGSVGVGIAGAAVFLVGLGSIGVMVLRETDAEWEHTPEYSGFRPAMHMR
jgi:hypothetical protein